MNKPLNLRVQEAKEQIIQTINCTGLPPFLLEPVLKDIYNEIVILKQNELNQSKTEYEKSIKKEQQTDKKD